MKILGIDLGNTIVCRTTKLPFENSFSVIKKITEQWDNVFIVSKVNDEQKVRSLRWIQEWNFFNLTGIKPENLVYCYERYEKAPIVEETGITHFIDDHPEVLHYMKPSVYKYIINPPAEEVVEYFNKLTNTRIVKNWLDIAKELNIKL